MKKLLTSLAVTGLLISPFIANASSNGKTIPPQLIAPTYAFADGYFGMDGAMGPPVIMLSAFKVNPHDKNLNVMVSKGRSLWTYGSFILTKLVDKETTTTTIKLVNGGEVVFSNSSVLYCQESNKNIITAFKFQGVPERSPYLPIDNVLLTDSHAHC